MSKIDDHYEDMYQFVRDVIDYVEGHEVYEGINKGNEDSIKDPIRSILGVLSNKCGKAMAFNNLKKKHRQLIAESRGSNESS